ncbi:hypothetical protein AU198_23865 [Mycobacterium sp. GA-1199]|nr:hypothetical protein AU198_23865 [Mycobacterium sp. GA-1199]
MELGVLGPLQVRQYGLPVAIPGAKPRAILTMLGLHGGSVVSAAALVALLWGDDPPRTATKALQTHISSLRRALGDGFVLTEGSGWTLSTTEIDAIHYKSAAKLGRKALAAADPTRAVTLFDQALALWRGIPELPDSSRGSSEKTRWLEGHAALVEDRADALLATGRAAEIVGELESAIAEAPLRERRWGHLMLALYRAGRQGEALSAYRRARSLLAEELGVDPGPELRRLEAAIVAQDAALEVPQSQQLSTVTRAVTFLLTDIEGSTAAWEADSDAMAVALARHDEIVEQFVTSRGGRLIKTRGEGDATFSVFDRPSAAAAAAIELQGAIAHEDWRLAEPMRIRVALHTGEVEFRDGDYFGRAVNRAARLRSLATGGQILCSGATAELVIDSLPDDVVLADLGLRRLRNLPRPEHVFELRMETADDPSLPTADAPMERPALPAVLVGPGPFVGRGRELERLVSAWQSTLAAGTRAVLIAGEPGVGKTRLAGEWSRHAYEQGAVVLYGRCDEDLGAPYQPFAEALRSLVSCVDSNRLRGVRGVESLLPLVPGLGDALPDVTVPPRADPDTERYAMFDAVVALLGTASATAPVVLILDDLHWAAKPTLLLLRHLLRFGDEARVQVIGTYRSTDLDRSHPLAAMLADLHRDGTATRLQLSGLDEGDVTAYVAEAGYDDEELGRALATVTGGNPFFLIEALRHVEESGGRWDPSTLPQGVREAVSRRLSRLATETNKALAAAAVVGSRFALTLVEQVVGEDLVDAFDEAGKAGIVIEEPGGRYRFNHALVRQSLLAELPSVRRMRLHQRIAVTLEAESGADDEVVAELAHHYFECAWAGNAAKAVEYCRRAADQAMSRVAYEGAADLYDRALHALEELDDELPDRDDLQAELLIAHCEALLAAGDVTSAKVAVTQLRGVAKDSGRLGAWGTCFDGELSMLTDPERLDEIESAVGAAAEQLAAFDDAAGEAKAHTVRAGCLARLGRIGDCETALDQALTAARRAREHGRVNAVLAGAPLAALWGPNPVPRAGGRCLDVVRLLRITTGSPLVEATSTRCQAVLDAFRGRAAEGRRLIESARRTLTELGLRHALLEVDQFAGIIELVADDAAAAEPYLRRAYEGFRRMGLDTDTADTAALLARTYLVLHRDAEADELCSESERLAGHGSKASIAWRTVRAQLLARDGVHDRARQVAEEAVSLAAGTDALVDHGDACLALATVLRLAGDTAGMRTAAEQAIALYDRKGAAALAEKARRVLGARREPPTPADQVSRAEPENACVRIIRRMAAAADRQAWEEYRSLYAPDVTVESRRRMVGFTKEDLAVGDWPRLAERVADSDTVRHRHSVIAVRGERLALCRLTIGGPDFGPDAAKEDILELYALDDEGRIARRVWFDAEDMDAALAELDDLYVGQHEGQQTPSGLENSASRADDRLIALFNANRLDEIDALFTVDAQLDDRRRGVRSESNDRATMVDGIRAIAAIGVTVTNTTLALRGERLCLRYMRFEADGPQHAGFCVEALELTEAGTDGRMVAKVDFDCDDVDAAFAELDARYANGEAATFAQTWSVITGLTAAFNRHEFDAMNCPSTDHRRLTRYAPGSLTVAALTQTNFTPKLRTYIEVVHRLSARGVAVTHRSYGTAQEGFEAEWRGINLLMIEGGQLTRYELFDEIDVDAALIRFDQLIRPTTRLENSATRIHERMQGYFANRDWAAASALMTQDVSVDDRRRLVNTEIRRGREATIASMQAGAKLGARDIGSVVIALRGNRLAMLRTRYSGSEAQPDGFHMEDFSIVEIDVDQRICAVVIFDLDDFHSAIAELEVRYVAGEAAPFARTWAVIAGAYASVCQRERPAMTPNAVTIDWRRGAAFEPEQLMAYIRGGRELELHEGPYVETVHRLNSLGAVVTYASKAASREGFEAEWREITLSTVDGELIDRCELFDETDLDTALTRFAGLSRPAHRLENAATRVSDRLYECFKARDWPTMAEVMADDFHGYDRRQVIGVDLHGRDAVVGSFRAVSEFGNPDATSTVLATRGERLALTAVRYDVGEGMADAFNVELLQLIEIDTDQRIASLVTFDRDAINSAFEELEARYIAGEAASHAQTWAVVAGIFACLARHEVPPATPDWRSIDHRRGTPLNDADLRIVVATLWDITPDLQNHVEKVHRLGDHGALCTQVSRGTTPEGFPAEWRMLNLTTVDGSLASGCELFDEEDFEAAIARFEELGRAGRRLENKASRLYERFKVCFASEDWHAITEMLAEDLSSDDRRHVINTGRRQGRDAMVAELKALAEVGAENVTSETIAIRGEHLVLSFVRSSQGQGGFRGDAIDILELGPDERVASRIVFDVDDIDAAYAELESRYLAGEASAHARAWSVIAGAYAAVLRHELPPTTADWVNVDHRRVTSFAPNELEPFLKATWDVLEHDIRIYVEAVHRLTDIGAVVTRVIKGTSREGFTAEWREIGLSTVDGDRINRSEVFDEADLDVALARFDELERPSALKNAASDVINRYCASFDARDWATMAETLAKDVITDDRRRVVNAGVRQGRDMHIADMRATAEVSGARVSSTVLATRGERLVLSRVRTTNSNTPPGEISAQMLGIVEIDADDRIAVTACFDEEDVDAAFRELDARYLAGEAAAYARTWSAILETFAAVNRGELPEVTRDCISLDHRRAVAFAPGELGSYIRATHSSTTGLYAYIEVVHRLNARGAVVSFVGKGASPQGFQAEWRGVSLSTVDCGLVNRNEWFDEMDLETALGHFKELTCGSTQLENAASRAVERFQTCFATRDWDAMAEILADDVAAVDHRPVMGAGLRFGRALNIGDWQSVAEVGFTTVTSTVIATRGERLTMGRFLISTGDNRYHNDVLGIVEIDASNRISTCLMFDVTDMDAALQELESRYLAGEAAAYARTWSVILKSYEQYDRHELPPTTPDWVNIDHRRVTTMPAGELLESSQATWDVTPDAKIHIKRVDRLNDVGAVFTQVVSGTSQEGFEAEWRMVDLVMIQGDLICRCEIFDDSDLDAALARFDELTPPARPVNVAYQMVERLWSCFAKRDWSATGELLAPDVRAEDRRRIVNDGLRQGREAFVANMRAVAEVGIDDVASALVATRGERLVLARVRTERFHSDVLNLVELDAGKTFITSTVVFDMEDLNAALTELDARYGAGEAADHGRTWTMLANAIAAFNRHELPDTTPDWVNVDHRSGTSIAPGQLFPYVRTSWELAPDISNYIEVVHQLNDSGAVITRVATGNSRDGFNAEWRVITLATFDGDLLSRVELFDETDLDAALARFEELRSSAPILTNTATKVDQRFLTRPENAATRALADLWERFDAQDWDAIQAAMAENFASYDRRQVVNAGVRRGRAIHIENMRSVGEVGFKNAGSPAIATRGERLALCRSRFTAGRGPRGEIVAEALMIIETDAANRLVSNTVFDLEALNEAFAELDAKYAAGEARPHGQTWPVVTRAYAALNRQEQFERDWIYTDHRRGTPFASTSSATSAHPDVWDVTPDLNAHIEVVHRLTDGAVLVTSVVGGSSQDGFEAEWRFVQLLTVASGSIERCELFDETDIDTAIARFDELSRPTHHLKNTATTIWTRAVDAFNSRDKTRFLALVAPAGRVEDRRKGLSTDHSGVVRAKPAQAVFEVPESWRTDMEVIAIRGSRLALIHQVYRDVADTKRPITVELLTVVEVGDDDLVADIVNFDADDIDAAFAALDTRYVAGEGSAHAHTWSVIAEAYAAFNRREIPSAEPAWVDHRLLATIQSGDLIANVGAAWDLVPDIKAHIATVHRLKELGAVVDILVRGSSREGFDAEYHEIAVVTVRGNTPDRFEMFDADNLDAAFARLDELSQRAPRIKNAATRMRERLADAFNRRDVDGFLALTSPDGRIDDRRKGLQALHDPSDRRRAAQALFEAPRTWRLNLDHIAIRGSRLSLTRQIYRDTDDDSQPVTIEHLAVVEINDDGLMHDFVNFDSDDLDAAFAELETRYLAGEAAAHARTWSAVADGYAAFNRRELFRTTPDWVNIDHRRGGTSFGPGEQIDFVNATWDVVPEIRAYAEMVHRLDTLGAVVTQVVKGSSQAGFDGEWREITLLAIDGDAISRCEMFDESDLDAALTRFDELNRSAHRLESDATLTRARLIDAFNKRDLGGFRARIAPDGRYDDLRKGLRSEGLLREEFVPSMLSGAPEGWRWGSEPIAIRGQRLALCRDWFRDTHAPGHPVTVDDLSLTEITEEGLVCHSVIFDSDDLDAAMRELDARWIASGEVAHSDIIEAHRRNLEMTNRHDWGALTAVCAGASYINHRQLGSDTADYIASISTLASLAPDLRIESAEILAVSAIGVATHVVVRGTSTAGLAIEVPFVLINLWNGDHVTHIEAFDLEDRDHALERFKELNESG